MGGLVVLLCYIALFTVAWLAVRAYAADAGLTPPDYPTRTILEALRARGRPAQP